jgi:hypothetical protein
MIWLNCLLKERKFFGLTTADIMHFAYVLAVRNKIKNQFFKRNENTGRGWLKYFLCRQQEILVTNIEGLHSQE